MSTKIHLRLTENQLERIKRHLFPGDDKEAVVLALCGALAGADRQIYCLHDILEVPLEACTLRTETSVRWNVQILIPILERSLKHGLLLFKAHSHPDGADIFSPIDNMTDLELARATESILERKASLISAFVTMKGKLCARVVESASGFSSINQVTVVGDSVTFDQPALSNMGDDISIRTRQAFGEGTTNLLRSLSVGVAGCSGTGSWVIELLGRLGVGRLVIVDPDLVERKNLNRIVNSGLIDAEQGKPKVEVLAKAIRSMGMGTIVETHSRDIAHREVVQSLASCDFLFGCVDSADGRDILNRISTYYLVPYIDVGVRFDADGHGGIGQICCAVHYLIPGGSSLLSRGVITSEQVQAEAMKRANPNQYDALRAEGYIKGIVVDRPAVVSVNGFAATHAVNEMLARLHPFRRDPNGEFRYQMFSLCEGAWLRVPDGPACGLLTCQVGRGDTLPLLGNPALS